MKLLANSVHGNLCRVLPVAIGLVAASSSLLQFAIAKECLSYEPAVVTLTGKITRHLEYGPPGFGESPATDAKEIYWYLDLDSAICTATTAGDQSTPEGQGEENIRKLQIVFPNGYPHGGGWVGHNTSITGTLFHAVTGHHHTPILITAEQIKKLP
jgi:hypothetical protein